MTIIRYETSMEEVSKMAGPIIFLAGPTVRGNQPHLTSWRIEAVETFKRLGYEGILILPEFLDRKQSDKGRRDLPVWEHNGLKNSNCIMFWIPRTKEEWGLNTNSEHHLWAWRSPSTVVYGRPDGAYRTEYNDVMWDHLIGERGFEKEPIYNTLEDTVKAAIVKAEKNYQLNCPRGPLDQIIERNLKEEEGIH